MKWILPLFLIAAPLQATTYYLSSTGNDSYNGLTSTGAFATCQHSFNSMSCGDTLDVVANGGYVQTCDSFLPYFPGCSNTTTVQSTNLSLLSPPGIRTTPFAVNGSSVDFNNYGKLQFTYQGIVAQNEVHGGWVTNPIGQQSQGISAGDGFSSISPIDGSGPSTFTVTGYYGGTNQIIANGSEIVMEVNAYTYVSQYVMPSPLVALQPYYVTNCQGPCGTLPFTFQVSSTVGGSPIAITSCPSPQCATDSVAWTQPLQVSVAYSSFTIPDNFSAFGTVEKNVGFTNGVPVTLNNIGLFSSATTMPAPLQRDTQYFITNLSGRQFQIAASSGGPPIVITSTGTGPLSVATMQSPNNWAFRGIEFYFHEPFTLYGFLLFGSGLENSRLSMVNHVEVDRCYMHDNPADPLGVFRGIDENSQYSYIHDNYIVGNRAGESQAIAGYQSLGPGADINNMVEGSGENTFWGGSFPVMGGPNANHQLIHNFYYKPPIWKIQSNNGVASGSCWWDNADPQHAGGEFYTDVGPIFSDQGDGIHTGTSGGGGSCANVQAVMTNGVITSLNILNGGGTSDGCSAYTSSFTITTGSITVETGSGFSVTFTTGSGQITGYKNLVGGSGFTPLYASSQPYQCQSNGQWGTSSSGPGFEAPTVKDTAETKSGTNFLYSGNLMEYIWAQAQSGEFMNMSDEPGSGANIANDHITFDNNELLHGFQYGGTFNYCETIMGQPCPSLPTDHFITNNLIVSDINACGTLFNTATNLCGFPMVQLRTESDTNALYSHNTLWAGDTWYALTSNGMPPIAHYDSAGNGCTYPSPNNKFQFINDIWPGDFSGDCVALDAIPTYFSNSQFSNSVLLRGTSNAAGYTSPGATNIFQLTGASSVTFPTSNNTISYVNPSAGNYHLTSTSTYSAQNASAANLSTDGKDMGADIDILNMAVSNAQSGLPTWDVLADLQISAGSSKAALRYNAPTIATCTVTLYNSQVRIPANVVETVSDSSTTAVVDGTRREILAQALTPSTAYTYGLACGNSELMIGSFVTHATGSGTYYFTDQFSTAINETYCTNPAMTSGCTTLGLSAVQNIPVASNSVIYKQPAGGQISMAVTP